MIDEGVEILLVEDNPYDEFLMLHALRKHKVAMNIHVVRDGAEALAFLFCTGAYAERPFSAPRVIVLDRNLPLVDGLEVLRQLRADPRTHLVPVVMLTSSMNERDVVESYEKGANSYVVKQVDFDLFTEAARKLGRYWAVINHAPQTLDPVPPGHRLMTPDTVTLPFALGAVDERESC